MRYNNFQVFSGLLLIIILAITESSGKVVIIGGKLFGQKNASILTSWEQTKTPKNFGVGYLLQPVDHKNPTQYPYWSQKYLTKLTNYSKSGPILIFIGGESEADPRYLEYGEMAEHGMEFQAAGLFFLEHRFYGESWPLGDVSVSSLKYLNMFQALDDLAKFVIHVQTTYNLKTNKVALYGGSYAGSLAAYFLKLWPHLASAGLASSAPIWYHFDFKEYIELTASALQATNPKCISILGAGVRQLNKLVQQSTYKCNYFPYSGNPDDQPCLVDLGSFPLCSPLNARKIHDVHQLNAYITQFFIYIAQYNNSLPTYFNLDALCQATLRYKEEEGDDLKVLAKIIGDGARGLYNSECVDYQADNLCKFMSVTGPEDSAAKHGARQWMWQTCSDFSTFPSTSGMRQPFGHVIPVAHFVYMCQCVFGTLYSEPYIRLRTDEHTTNFGSFNTLRPHVVYLNGNTDPVAGLGYTKPSQFQTPYPTKNNALFIIERGSHCDDLYAYNPDKDSESLQQARNETLQVLRRWLSLE